MEVKIKIHRDKTDSEKIEQFLSARGYERGDGTVFQPAELGGVKIYRKVFGPPAL